MMERVGKASPLEVVCVEEMLNIMFSKKSGPTSYAERNIENGYAFSLGRLLINEPILRHIKNCTEEEVHWKLGKNELSTTLDELDAFISILYARGIYTVQII
ncbi:hypothetical protein TNCV_4404791 [Trichonephila clavipes]|uniref:Uncharacterized protein n=1 Tax=Trichonephila clavipes TaxID=2585209 RepID=A0A8X6V5Q1_TRICX|nr:hypothetical protein TNCV_4404791 [Trichonephila clavipes]